MIHHALIDDTAGVLFVLAANAAFWFFLERRTGWKLFQFIPPLIFIYVLPAVFSNAGLIPHEHGVYSFMGDIILP
ncbi:MAG TPA: DUF819 family protein, partial [Bacteroidetes bacterium]|nr:DUF819 family protein [Bacteroidota bacterium]